MPSLPRPVRDFARYPMRRIALEAQLLEPYRRRRFHSFGTGSILHRPGGLLGSHRIAIGHHSLILGGCHLAVETPAWGLPEPALRIGNRVGIRPYCFLSASGSIVIEDDVIIGAMTSVIDSDHSFADGRPNVMHNRLVVEPVRIGRGTWLAERVAVLRGSDIGRCCIIGANSVVRGAIPDYSIAVGAPARVVGEVAGVDADAPPLTDRLF